MLFDLLKIRSVQFKNRIAISPMCQYSSVDGFANDWHLVHLGSRALGGAALVIQEATAVTKRGRISPDDMGLWKDEQIEPLQRITGFIKKQGSVPGIQLAHAGRKASMSSPWKGGKRLEESDDGWITQAPSAIPFNEGYTFPEAMLKQDITQIISAFKSSAIRALDAGFEVIEIHGAHGYLINSFLSPLSNQRTDEYGGSFDNRIRFVIEIISHIRTVWPEKHPLFLRISCTDYSPDGWDIASSVRLSAMVKQMGVDLIDCSSGGLIPNVRIPLVPGYQVPFAETIKKETGVMTGAVGLITTASQANEIIESGKADMVLIARESLRRPYFPLTAAKELGKDLDWPLQYLRAK
ncbi:MAG TPA: NADH:flavin oxidoreductase/NADH oxidase [Puia sp.]|jgi:2,4-dienoyl-CoA reductase-like NADH-dependent reductase (Old Yellow Enzyme family)